MDALPKNETPETTEEREGFYHLYKMSGGVDKTVLEYIVRDHDRDLFEARKRQLQKIASDLNQELGTDRIAVTLTDQYFNMREKVEPVMHIVDIAQDAMEEAGIEPLIKPIRGGTDGSQLSYMGLPCPNIFAGGHNFHGPYEYVPVESMEKAIEVIVNIARITAERYQQA
jgi:tripeptide aminopeptidase